MKFAESFIIALRSLTANKLRSSLTMLGIIIGVGAVITLVSVGRGAQASITATFEGLGTNVVYVQPQNPDAPGFAALSPGYAEQTLTLADTDALAEIPGVVGIAPTNENFVEVVAGTENVFVVIHGSTAAYLEAYGYQLGWGQFITERNVKARDMVVVLGSKVANDLFGLADPVGQTVKIKDKRFTVIGVLAPKGGSMMGFNLDDVTVVPITTFQSRLFAQQSSRGEDTVQSVAVKVASADEMAGVKQDIETVLRKRHDLGPEDKNDFAIVSPEQVLGVFQQITGVFTLFLGAIASISLLVGSIGIMNIMLVSVTERTREIGLRKAVGAKRRDILLQFLLEAAMLSLVGGTIGLTGGWLLSTAISLIDLGGFRLHASVSLDVVILALSVSVFVGLFSGIYPAMRAARLNPIDALHYG